MPDLALVQLPSETLFQAYREAIALGCPESRSRYVGWHVQSARQQHRSSTGFTCNEQMMADDRPVCFGSLRILHNESTVSELQ